MKHFLYILIVVITVTGCKRATYITFETDEIWFGIEGGDTTITVKSDGKWEVDYCPSWVNVEVKNDSMLAIRTQYNNTGTLQTDKIVLKSGDVMAMINVKQTSKGSYIIPETKMIEFDKEGGTHEVRINTDGSNVDVKALVIREVNLNIGKGPIEVKTNDCLKADYHNGVLKVSIPENGDFARLGKIWLSSDAAKTTLYVAQKGTGQCSLCGGVGMVKCSECKGNGFRYIKTSGLERKEGCSACGGSGFEEKTEGSFSSVNYESGCGYVDCPQGVTGL